MNVNGLYEAETPLDHQLDSGNSVVLLEAAAEGPAINAVDAVDDAIGYDVVAEAESIAAAEGKAIGRVAMQDVDRLSAPRFNDGSRIQRYGGAIIGYATAKPNTGRQPVEPVAPTIEVHERKVLTPNEKAERLVGAGAHANTVAVSMELFHKRFSELTPHEQVQVGMVTDLMSRQRPRPTLGQRVR